MTKRLLVVLALAGAALTLYGLTGGRLSAGAWGGVLIAVAAAAWHAPRHPWCRPRAARRR